MEKQPSDVFYKKGALRNFAKKETLAQVFSCEFCKISSNTFFIEHLWTTAPGFATVVAFSAWFLLQISLYLIVIGPGYDSAPKKTSSEINSYLTRLMTRKFILQLCILNVSILLFPFLLIVFLIHRTDKTQQLIQLMIVSYQKLLYENITDIQKREKREI